MRFILKWKIRTQINIGLIVMILLIFITIMVAMHMILRTSYFEQENVIISTYGKQIATNIENRLEYYMSYLSLLSSDSELYWAMAHDDFQNTERLFEEISSEFVSLNAGRISAIRLYRNGIYKPHDGLYHLEDIFTRFTSGYWAYYDNYVVTGAYMNKKNEKVFSIFRRLHQANTERDYYVELCIYETELFSFINENESLDRILLFQDDLLISMSDRELFSSLLYHAKSKNANGIHIDQLSFSSHNVHIKAEGSMGFTILIETNMDHVMRGYNTMLMRMIPIVGGVMVVALAFIELLSIQLQRRLTALQLKIVALSSGKLERDLHIPGRDEFALLSIELDETRKQILSLIQQNDDAHEMQRIAEMSALRAQISSHFLFNALSSIKWLYHYGDDALPDAVDKLASFLRYSLALDENLVSLCNEVEHLKAYIYLQKLRYDDEIRFHIDVDEELMQLKTVKFVLQPLFENAIYHGRRENGSPLNITLYSEKSADGKTYDLIIEDNGNGISPQRIRAIYDENVVTSQSGYGLQNVIVRLRLCSRGLGRVLIESQLDKYTKITIRQPIA